MTNQSAPQTEPRSLDSSVRNAMMLFLASFVALYFELVIIRYLSSEIRIFAYLKNLSLIASFFGIGYGLIGKSSVSLRRWFPLISAALFLLIAFATPLKFTHIAFSSGEYVTPDTSRPWAKDVGPCSG